MGRWFRVSLLGAALIVLLAPSPVESQDAAPAAPKGPAPRKPGGKPDFSGVWQSPRMADVTKDTPCCKGVPQLPFTAWGKQQWESYDPVRNGDYAGSCLPFGFLRTVYGPHPIHIVQDNDQIVFLAEQNKWFHLVPTDGRVFADLEYGPCLAHWLPRVPIPQPPRRHHPPHLLPDRPRRHVHVVGVVVHVDLRRQDDDVGTHGQGLELALVAAVVALGHGTDGSHGSGPFLSRRRRPIPRRRARDRGGLTPEASQATLCVAPGAVTQWRTRLSAGCL